MIKKLSILSQGKIVATLCCVIIVLFSSCGRQLESNKVNERISNTTDTELRLPGYTPEESEYISRLIMNWNEIEKEMGNLAFSLYNREFSNSDGNQQTSDRILLLTKLFDEKNHFVVPSTCTEIQKVYIKGVDEYKRQISGISSANESSDEVAINSFLEDIAEEDKYLELLPMKMEEIKSLN
ncbi:MAG: hypothetical protein PHI40_05605 [Caldisericia bacterium]|nr:hypothetical protein [Caldisericia bacterium]MDD4614863.1 hypothetical protein [Caldisericia bacterium]